MGDGNQSRPLFWLTLLFWVAVFFPGMVARGDTNWMPGERHYRAASQGSDCSIYRTLALRATKELAHDRAAFSQQREILKHRRATLEECARHRGVRAFNSDEDEALAAEVCPDEYQSWLTPGYRLTVVRQDLNSERESLQRLTLQLQLYCRAMPLPAAVVE